MIDILVYVLIAAAVLIIIHLVCRYLGVSQQLRNIILIVVALIFLIGLLYQLRPLLSNYDPDLSMRSGFRLLT